MTLQQCGYPVAISQQLTNIIDQALQAYDDDTWLGFIIYFQNPVDRAESGPGSDLVEIHIDAQQRIKTVKDYAYVGQGPSAKLIKQLDFDFFYRQFQNRAGCTRSSAAALHLPSGSSIFAPDTASKSMR